MKCSDKVKVIEIANQLVISMGLGNEAKRMIANEYGVSLEADESILKLDTNGRGTTLRTDKKATELYTVKG